MNDLKIFDENGKALHLDDVLSMLPKEHLKRIVWDGFLVAEQQDEQWHEGDTCNLIVKKILNNGPIEYSKGPLP